MCNVCWLSKVKEQLQTRRFKEKDFSKLKLKVRPGVVGRACNPSSLKAEAGRLRRVGGQPGLLGEMSQINKQTNKQMAVGE